MDAALTFQVQNSDLCWCCLPIVQNSGIGFTDGRDIWYIHSFIQMILSILVVLGSRFSLQYTYFRSSKFRNSFCSLIYTFLYMHKFLKSALACLVLGAWPQEWQVTTFQVHSVALLRFLCLACLRMKGESPLL
ncbi:unnamed protein product [Triticum turgidum subsp. durum]|uniref:Uncharacterized protein n=1 Tax=Triticum turgidum subsp. durum TaxID=4567 RepID=A0A9R1ARY6_TRITD|nr:unnamed protein product [Triticum turgidum subsp. durum]